MFRQLAPGVVLDGAVCVNYDPQTFDDADEWIYPELTQAEVRQLNLERRLRARVICSGCPVRQQCLEWAIEEEVATGFVGGLTPGDRERLRKGVIPHRAIPRQREARPATSNGDAMVRDFLAGATLAEVVTKYDSTERTVLEQINRSAV